MRIALFLLHNLVATPVLALVALGLYPFSARVRRGWRLRFAERRRLLDFAATAPLPFDIWTHVASVGEFQMALAYVTEHRARVPGCRWLLTYSSDSLYDWLQQARPDRIFGGLGDAGAAEPDATFLWPWDTWGLARRVNDGLRPRALVLLRYDFWPNLMMAARSRGVPIIGLGVALRNRGSALARLIRRWRVRQLLTLCDAVYAADDATALALRELAGGRWRDRIHRQRSSALALGVALRLRLARSRAEPSAGTGNVLLVGSAHESDVDELLAAWDTLAPAPARLRVIVAPHNPGGATAARLTDALRARGQPFVRWSLAPGASVTERLAALSPDDWVLVDTLGDLFELYGHANFAWVGNAGRGVHNVLEPVAFGCPVAFRPPFANSGEAQALVRARAAWVLDADTGPAAFLAGCASRDPALAAQAGRATRVYRELLAGSAEELSVALAAVGARGADAR